MVEFLGEIDRHQQFLSKSKENNENDVVGTCFFGYFYSSRQPSQIGPTADFDGAAIPPPKFSMIKSIDDNL